MAKKWILMWLLVALSTVSSGPAVADDEAEAAAVEAAVEWLAVVDDGDYAESWKLAAEYFKGAVTEEKWEQALTGARQPLGALVSRQLRSKQYATSLPGAPDGEYVVIQFETSFENKAAAIETVTPMLEEDGEWRVSGYFIK